MSVAGGWRRRVDLLGGDGGGDAVGAGPVDGELVGLQGVDAQGGEPGPEPGLDVADGVGVPVAGGRGPLGCPTQGGKDVGEGPACQEPLPAQRSDVRGREPVQVRGDPASL